jgi:hypothetical protein
MLTPMKSDMSRAKAQLEDLLAKDAGTAGMDVRVHGDNLILAREVDTGNGGTEIEDRVRLTKLNATRWGLSVKRHTGRWERTPFSGSMKELVENLLTFMQHLVAPY